LPQHLASRLAGVGTYNHSESDGRKIFLPYGVTIDAVTGMTTKWPAPNITDSSSFYSFNPHATDSFGLNGGTRRILFGWILGETTNAVDKEIVPYWDSMHSLARLLTVSGSSLVQQPAPEIKRLRDPEKHWIFGETTVQSGTTVTLQDLSGDALEIVATFNVSIGKNNGSRFGLALRVGGNNTAATLVGYCPETRSMGIGALDHMSSIKLDWKADIISQPTLDVVELHIFLDRSVVEVFSGGAALTGRCNLPPNADAAEARGVQLWSEGGADAQLLSLEAWAMSSMWRGGV
jgi:sucrose-6-phosphate hydrolase SacC (GH32 family)